ncbi:MAG TPA: acyl-homoserine-lactone synthase [Ktedonobacterales bacterium]|jgi:N-acyl-L-homoserine lactone synthetase|nr:acyl-homoserine-lactone synthase [Ktedonobacterales bacterium]
MTLSTAVSQLDHQDTSTADIVHSRCGVALPRVARQRSTVLHSSGTASPRATGIEYSVRSFTARSQRERATLESAFRLRASVLVYELGWLLPNGIGIEQDRCDASATHVAALAYLPGATTPTLAGYARVLLPRHGFMLRREFAELLDETHIAFDETSAFEISRMVVDPRFRGQRCREGRTVTEHLGRAIAGWALARGKTECYTVCETRHIRALQWRGIRFERFGREVEYQRGVPVCAAVLRLTPLVDEWREQRPADLAWYWGTSSWSAH